MGVSFAITAMSLILAFLNTRFGLTKAWADGEVSGYPCCQTPGERCDSFCRLPKFWCSLTGRHLWWAPALFCRECLSRMSDDRLGWLFGLYLGTLAGSVLFVDARFSIIHAGGGAVQR